MRDLSQTELNELVLKLADINELKPGPARNAFREKAERLLREFIAAGR